MRPPQDADDVPPADDDQPGAGEEQMTIRREEMPDGRAIIFFTFGDADV